MRMIFVFGSNLAGRHGKGAAKWALQHRGAIYGQGEGLQGQSYAIPTKDKLIKTLPADHPEMIFQLTPIGCGLAGYSPADIAPMFLVHGAALHNVILPEEFITALA
jgi:hypothetical protein